MVVLTHDDLIEYLDNKGTHWLVGLFKVQYLSQISLSQLLPLQRRTCPKYFWMLLNFLQHVCTLYLGHIWRLCDLDR